MNEVFCVKYVFREILLWHGGLNPAEVAAGLLPDDETMLFAQL